MQPGAPLLHDDLFTVGVEPKPDKPSNVAKRIEIALGDIEAGFAKADVIVEREFNTAPVHQGYIEPHATIAGVSEDGSAEVWCSTQGHFIVRAHCARLLGMGSNPPAPRRAPTSRSRWARRRTASSSRASPS
jgi:CO/xanthine dehydrogenase Mo-binding subunit